MWKKLTELKGERRGCSKFMILVKKFGQNDSLFADYFELKGTQFFHCTVKTFETLSNSFLLHNKSDFPLNTAFQ